MDPHSFLLQLLEKSSWLLMFLKQPYLPDKILMCWRDFFLFFWRCDQFSFWTKWALRHVTYSGKWEIQALLRWFLSQKHLQLNFSLFFPLSMLLQVVPDLTIDSLTNQFTVPLDAREVGFCWASPGVGSRGSGHTVISGLFLLIIPSDGSHFCQ